MRSFLLNPMTEGSRDDRQKESANPFSRHDMKSMTAFGHGHTKGLIEVLLEVICLQLLDSGGIHPDLRSEVFLH